jgi:PAS domain S-box-containing protein
LIDQKKTEHVSRLQQQTALARFGKLSLKSDDLDEILTEACRAVESALRAGLAKVMELQDDGRTLLVRAGVGWKPGVIGMATVNAADDTSEGHAILTSTPTVSSDIVTEARFKYATFLIDHGVKAFAIVPIIGIRPDAPFGILEVDSRTSRRFTEEDTSLLESYSNLIAAAVDRLRVIAATRHSEARFLLSKRREEAALRTGLISFFEWDMHAERLFADRYFAIFSGLGSAEIMLDASAFYDAIHPDDVVAVKNSVVAALEECSNFESRFRFLHQGGNVRWVHMLGQYTEASSPASVRYSGTAVDITISKENEIGLRRTNEILEARMQAQQARYAQEESEARFRFATQAGRFGVWEIELPSGTLTTSPMCRENLGLSQDGPMTYLQLCDAVHPDDRTRMVLAIEHSMAAGGDFDIECRIVRGDGTLGWVEMFAQILRSGEGAISRMAGFSLDITDRVRTTEHVRQSQAIEAVGRLTAGVAHDFNNVLQALQGSLELAIAEVGSLPSVRSDLELALQTVERGARLTSHLLSFSRQQALHPVSSDLKSLLTGLWTTLSRTLGHSITVHLNLPPELPSVFADVAHLDAALLNLALNARDSMPQGGQLWVEARTSDNQVVITVADDGAGMTPEVLAHACDPFFSTKGPTGSGLGLSMAQGFVRQSGGELRIESILGKGTRIELWLPAGEGVPPPAQADRGSQEAAANARILVVDDDSEVARVTTAFLRKAGYHVTTVTSSSEAMATMNLGLKFDALITDYAMPGMSGADLIVQARELQPGLPALVMTGYVGAEGLSNLSAGVAVLRKPFHRIDLVQGVADLVKKSRGT